MTQLSVKPVALALSALLAISYVLCVIYGLLFHEFPMHPAWEALLPGFSWLTWKTFLLGLFETIIYGFYVALVFVPLFNYFGKKFPAA